MTKHIYNLQSAEMEPVLLTILPVIESKIHSFDQMLPRSTKEQIKYSEIVFV